MTRFVLSGMIVTSNENVQVLRWLTYLGGIILMVHEGEVIGHAFHMGGRLTMRGMPWLGLTPALHQVGAP
jgi:glutamine amidotransferase PdxT